MAASIRPLARFTGQQDFCASSHGTRTPCPAQQHPPGSQGSQTPPGSRGDEQQKPSIETSTAAMGRTVS